MQTVTYLWIYFALFCLAMFGMQMALQRAMKYSSHRWTFWTVLMAVLALTDAVALIQTAG